MKKFTFSAFAVLVGLLPVASGCMHATSAEQRLSRADSSPSHVVERYYQLAAEGSLAKAREYETNTVSEDILVPKTPAGSEWVDFVGEGRIGLVRIESEVIDGGKAEVVASLRDVDHKVHPFIHHLYRQQGRWKIFTAYQADHPVCINDPDACHIIKK